MKRLIVYTPAWVIIFSAAYAADRYTPAMRDVITMCHKTACAFPVQDGYTDNGARHYRVAIENEHDRDIQRYVFSVALAMWDKNLSWAAWMNHAVLCRDWQIKPFYGYYFVTRSKTAYGEGLELIEHTHCSYKAANLEPYLKQCVREFCNKTWEKNATVGGETLFVTQAPLNQVYNTDEPEEDFLRALMVKNNVSGVQVFGARRPHAVWIHVEENAIDTVKNVLGLRISA